MDNYNFEDLIESQTNNVSPVFFFDNEFIIDNGTNIYLLPYTKIEDKTIAKICKKNNNDVLIYTLNNKNNIPIGIKKGTFINIKNSQIKLELCHNAIFEISPNTIVKIPAQTMIEVKNGNFYTKSLLEKSTNYSLISYEN